MFHALRLVCLVLWAATLAGAANVSMAADGPASSQATPPATARPVDPMEFYAEVMSGRQDGMIILWVKDLGFDVAVHCIGGVVNFAAWIEVNGDLVFTAPKAPVSCRYSSLLPEFTDSELVIRTDPKDGWTLTPDGNVAECHGSSLVSVRWNPSGYPEAKTDKGWPACAGNPVG